MFKNNPSTMEFYEEIKDMTEDKLSHHWRECTEREYFYMLEVLPPIRWKDGAFMVGECLTHGIEGGLYDAYIQVGKAYFTRPGYLLKFNPEEYERQIK